MSNKCINKIKKEDKKFFKSFIIRVVVAIIIGGIVGGVLGGKIGAMYVNLKQGSGVNVASFLINILEKITPFISLILSILVIIVSKIIYTNSRKGYQIWKEENKDDNSIDKIQEKLSYLMLIVSVNIILGFSFFGIGLMLLCSNNISNKTIIIKGSCLMIGFILCMISSILIQDKIIKLEKEINPLLKGNIYDRNFAKEWLDSCDESIKLGIFKSAYKAFNSVSTTCIILWIFCILGNFMWDFGIMPLIMVTIIWLVQTISYCREAIKYSKIK